MLSTLSRNITFGTTYTAIEHCGQGVNTTYHLLCAKFIKGELIPFKQESFETLKDITAHIPKKQHIHLVVNNDQVLAKQVPTHSESLHAVHQAFSSIKIVEFYYQVTTLESEQYVTICRKSYLDELVSTYEKLGYYVTGWSFGAQSIQTILPFLNKEESIVTSSQRIYTSLENRVTIHNEDVAVSQYDLEDITIPSTQLLNLGTLIWAVNPSANTSQNNFTERQKELNSHYKNQRFLQIGLPVALGLLLLIFLGNFLVYNHYFSAVDSLSKLEAVNRIQKDNLQEKEALTAQKQKRFEDVIKSSSSDVSRMADIMLSNMPEEILLTIWEYQPIARKIRQGKPINLTKDQIIITGIAQNNVSLTEWITYMEQLDFVAHVAINELSQEVKSSRFTLSLTLVSS